MNAAFLRSPRARTCLAVAAICAAVLAGVIHLIQGLTELGSRRHVEVAVHGSELLVLDGVVCPGVVGTLLLLDLVTRIPGEREAGCAMLIDGYTTATKGHDVLNLWSRRVRVVDGRRANGDPRLVCETLLAVLPSSPFSI